MDRAAVPLTLLLDLLPTSRSRSRGTVLSSDIKDDLEREESMHGKSAVCRRGLLSVVEPLHRNLECDVKESLIVEFVFLSGVGGTGCFKLLGGQGTSEQTQRHSGKTCSYITI